MRNAWVAVLAFFCASMCFGAEVNPNRPVRLLVAASIGSTADFAARIIAQKLSEQLGQRFVVDNRAGAGGIVGIAVAARAAPDGYTLLYANPNFTLLPAVNKSVPYDPVKDFTPILMMARFTNMMVVSPLLKVNTLTEFIALAQKNPGKLNYGAQEVGSIGQLWHEFFKKSAHVDIKHIPYKGGGEIETALHRGEIQLAWVGAIPSYVAHIKSGQLRALAVTTDGKRSPVLPDVPSIIEAGLPATLAVYSWHGIVAPKGTPSTVLNKLNREVVKILADPAVSKLFVEGGGEILGSSPEEFTQFIRDDTRRWIEVVKAVGIAPM